MRDNMWNVKLLVQDRRDIVGNVELLVQDGRSL